MTGVVVSFEEYLTKLASAQPVPGGGSAALVVGAAGCSLIAMVARICAASKKYEAVHDVARRLVSASDELREKMLRLRTQDEIAFESVVAARVDKTAMQRALYDAATVPLEGAGACVRALRLAGDALTLHNRNLVSDIGCAGEFAHAALIACAYNVRINHKYMQDAGAIERQERELAGSEQEGTHLLETVRHAVRTALLRT